MSWKACAFVKELRDGLMVTEKFVLLILAEYHRTDEKLAWPSVTTLAKDCLMTDRGVQQILARLVQKDFIRRSKGGGRGNVTGYQIVGVDIKKGELETLNADAVNDETVNQTTHSDAPFIPVKGERNPAQPCSAIRKEPVLEPVLESNGEEIPGELHPHQYAAKIIDDLQVSGCPIVSNRQTIEAISGLLSAHVRGGKSPPAAYQQITAKALDDHDSGMLINAFYFTDGQRGQSGKQSTSAAGSRSQRSIESLTNALRKHVSERDSPNQGKRKN